jgi:hypothetical protein
MAGTILGALAGHLDASGFLFPSTPAGMPANELVCEATQRTSKRRAAALRFALDYLSREILRLFTELSRPGGVGGDLCTEEPLGS